MQRWQHLGALILVWRELGWLHFRCAKKTFNKHHLKHVLWRSCKTAMVRINDLCKRYWVQVFFSTTFSFLVWHLQCYRWFSSSFLWGRMVVGIIFPLQFGPISWAKLSKGKTWCCPEKGNWAHAFFGEFGHISLGKHLFLCNLIPPP